MLGDVENIRHLQKVWKKIRKKGKISCETIKKVISTLKCM